VGSIIVISGPVGAGKSTVAKALVRAATAPTAYLEGDVFWTFLARPISGGPRRNLQSMMRAMTRAAAAFAADDYEVILDFSIPPAFLERAAARLGETELHFVVLKPALAVCAARAASRSEGVIADYDAYADFYVMFDAADRHVIANDDLAPEDVAARIRAGVSAGAFRFGVS
jgi:chloramphenicol 3-O-phosphotransferase